MMNSIKLSLTIIIILIININFCYSVCTGSGEDKECSDQQARDDFKRTASNVYIPDGSTVTKNSDGTFTIDQGPITLNGQSVNGNNIKFGSDGSRIDSANQLKQGNNGLQGVKSAEPTPQGTSFTHADVATGKGYSASNVENGFQGTDGSFSVGSLDSFNYESIIISNSQSFNFDSITGIIKADHADSFTTLNSISTDIDNLEVKPTVFSVGSADLVISGCVNVGNAKNSTFQIYNNAVVVQSGNGTSFNITDCDMNDVEFFAVGANSNITILKSVPPKYQIYNGILKNAVNGYSESVIGNDSVIIEMGHQGFRCLEMNPVASYWYSENTVKDFGINVMSDSEKYKLCLKKLPTDVFTESDGRVDFVSKKIELKRVVNYLRYPFENSQLTGFNMQVVYEGKDNNNRLVMQLDNDFTYVNDFFIELKQNESKVYSVVNNGFHTVTEEFENSRYDRLKEEKSAEVVKQYSASNLPYKIYFYEDIAENTLTQKSLSQLGRVTVFPPIPDSKIIYSEMIQRLYEERRLKNE